MAGDTPVARGDDWAVDLDDVRDAAALLPYPEWRRLADDDAVRRRALEAAVRRALVRARAEGDGAATDPSDRAAILRDFVEQGEQWALQLGFAPGMTGATVRAAARAALSDSGQNASLARDGLRREWGGMLHRWTPIHLGETRPGGAA